MTKQVYFAFQIYDGEQGAEIAVNIDPAALWEQFAEELNIVKDAGGIETIEIGQVLADSVEDAINAVRADRWLDGDGKRYYARADGVGVPNQRRNEMFSLFTKKETVLLLKMQKHERCATITSVERKSDKEFDLLLKGTDSRGNDFSAWLPLAFIRELPWTTPAIAHMTDYPDMTHRGDWSGVRDTDDDKLWAIFHAYNR